MSGGGSASSESSEQAPASRGLAGFAARAIVWLRFLIVPGWIGLAVLATVNLPSISETGGGGVGSMVPKGSTAVATEADAYREFGTPALSRSVVILRDSRGLPAAAQTRAIAYLARLNREPRPIAGLLGALPVPNLRPPLSTPESGTAVLGLLFPDPALGTGEQTQVATEASRGLEQAAGRGSSEVSGVIPAETEGWSLVSDRLPLVEIVMVAAVFLVVAWQFRAVGVPLLNLAGVALAYLISVRVVAEVGEQLNLQAPQEVEPLIVALLFGVVTDYLIFFVYGFRRRLGQGMDPRRSAIETTAGLLPVVLTAGLIIAGACATLLLADLSFLRSFGPGMAVSVLVSIAVAITFFPAALALTGDRLFWPRKERSVAQVEKEPRGRITGLAARFPLVVGVLCLALLASAATGLREMSLGNPVMRGLPSDADAARGFASVSRAFGPGLIAPTLLVAKGSGIGTEHSRVARLQSLVSNQPGVGGVIGPATVPAGLAGTAMSAPGGAAVRFFVITDFDPYGGTAIDTIDALDARLPTLLARAGLGDAEHGVGGDTALTGELVGSIGSTGLQVGPTAIAWVFLLLALLLRALVAPLYLVAASVLGVAAALGLTVYVFQDLLGYGQLSLFVPFSAAILLLALGSDYSVFVVARIWQESRHRDLTEAIRVGGSRAGSAIRTAGLILALSFAAVALIPEQAFRELGFAMAAGLMIDTLLVRALLVPALIAGFGRGGAWPGPGLRAEARDGAPSVPEAPGDPATSAKA